jgi:uncharacterized protein DUF3298/peptidoglycan-N-acetylmuramic acid deacetylase PdaC-like protein
MNLPRQVLITCLLVALFVVGGCRKSSGPNTPAANPGSATEAQQHPEGGAATVAETRYFSGSIGSALGLQMKLVREGEALTGSYAYQKVGTKIDLRGSVDKDGNVTLEEFDSGARQTGIFKGQWKLDSDGLVEITGNWTNPKGEKKTTFSLSQEPIEFSNGVEIVSRQIKEKNKKLKYEVAVDYPQLAGSTDPNFEKFNQTVRSLVNRHVGGFKKDMVSAESEPTPDSTVSPPVYEDTGSDITIGYTVALAKNDLISIQFVVSSYYAGAAHPNSSSEVVNFDLKNGKQLKLAELFQPGAKYVQAISNYCVKDLTALAQKQGADGMLDEQWIQRGAGSDLKNYQNWTITKKGLSITFDTYQVAAYAAGPQNVVVPYSALKDITKPDGPVGQFAK